MNKTLYIFKYILLLAGAVASNHAQAQTIKGNVYGGGEKAKVEGSATVNILGGIVTQDVYGGGALADVTKNTERGFTGNTTVNLFSGSVGNAYGGGLGQLKATAIGTEGQDGYVPAKEAIEAHVEGDAIVTLGKGVGDPDANGIYSEYIASVVNGSIFGANNVNGTPQGHVKVHVLKTMKRAKPNTDPVQYEDYDVPAIYGGGNQAAYIPSQATFDANKGFTEVLIENCDNSIAYVYGGGNAAPVPATQVTIYGANAIDNAFAGGNGAGDGNPGADIGYNGFYSNTGETTPIYGSGETHITVYGGTVNNVYGGSNTLGYIRTHAYVGVLELPNDYTGSHCELVLGNVSVGGNEAEMFCDGTMNLSCSGGATAVYAGANKADVHGNIDVVISSGTYGKVFGGNNESGNIYGHINLSIDETGCWPVMIGELYGCGNKAAYSVYGYTNEGPRTKEQYDAMTDADKTAAGIASPYDDPTINLISFTRIGKVFGGGFGETAKLYGTANVNINPIKGKYAGNSVAPIYVLNANDERVALSSATTFPDGLSKDNDGNLVIPGAVGTIGSIYGGGNAGNVIGNTEVNIGTVATNKHVKDKDDDTVEPEAVTVNIKGNVYGGGYEATVSGNTNVTIGK